jgi:hypothetical protein
VVTLKPEVLNYVDISAGPKPVSASPFSRLALQSHLYQIKNYVLDIPENFKPEFLLMNFVPGAKSSVAALENAR